jgi:O-acetyl-ADP-ribose deacetylase
VARIEVLEGDITKIEADAIVNAANNDLQLGGGVAGAIRRVGGPTIQAECDRHGPVEVGQAAITGAGDLPAKYVIHAASMSLGSPTTESNLKSSVRATLRLADSHGVKSISFPAIGAGIAGFPVKKCAKVMKKEIEKHLKAGGQIETIKFVLFGTEAYETFLDVFGR